MKGVWGGKLETYIEPYDDGSGFVSKAGRGVGWTSLCEKLEIHVEPYDDGSSFALKAERSVGWPSRFVQICMCPFFAVSDCNHRLSVSYSVRFIQPTVPDLFCAQLKLTPVSYYVRLGLCFTHSTCCVQNIVLL